MSKYCSTKIILFLCVHSLIVTAASVVVTLSAEWVKSRETTQQFDENSHSSRAPFSWVFFSLTATYSFTPSTLASRLKMFRVKHLFSKALTLSSVILMQRCPNKGSDSSMCIYYNHCFAKYNIRWEPDRGQWEWHCHQWVISSFMHLSLLNLSHPYLQ